MSAIPQDIVDQVRELERLRAEGCVDGVWYLRTRAAIVRRYSERRAQRPRRPASDTAPAVGAVRSQRVA